MKDPTKLPDHLLADEKHLHFNGHKAYIATTVAQDCVLGASVALAADEAALTDAYGDFKQEAQQLRPDYTPRTINIDGWLATQNAWQTLFKPIVIIHCFLHAFLKIRDRCKRLKTSFPDIKHQVWSIYRAKDKANFRTQRQALLK